MSCPQCNNCGRFLGKSHICGFAGAFFKGKRHTEEWKRELREREFGSSNPHWKGGRIYQNGYVKLKLRGHPAANSIGYVYEHILVMEKHLGRFLKGKEEIHHINRIKDDNRIENLKLFENHSQHCKEHNFGKRIVCTKTNRRNTFF